MMDAGRELNKQIAEKVMGWALNAHVAVWCPPDEKDNRYHTGYFFENQWNPSTNIADAWRVVERMKVLMLDPYDSGDTKRYNIVIEYRPQEERYSGAATDEWRVSWVESFNREIWTREFETVAPTLPLAICRAALAALASSPAQPEENKEKGKPATKQE